MEHYIVQAIIHGRIADSQLDEAIETLTRLPPLKDIHAVRLQGRSVIRNLTFIEFELLIFPEANAHDVAAVATHNLVSIASENTYDPDFESQRIREALHQPHDKGRVQEAFHDRSHSKSTFELLHAEGFHMGHDNQPQPIAPLLTPDVATNALRADIADTWRALLEPFSLVRPIIVGKLP